MKRKALEEERQRRKDVEAALEVNRLVLKGREVTLRGIREELSHVCGVHYDAWKFGYTEGLERMKTHILQNPQCDLKEGFFPTQ